MEHSKGVKIWVEVSPQTVYCQLRKLERLNAGITQKSRRHLLAIGPSSVRVTSAQYTNKPWQAVTVLVHAVSINLIADRVVRRRLEHVFRDQRCAWPCQSPH